MDTALQKGYVTLIKCAVTGQSEPLPEDFPREDVLKLAAAQQVVIPFYYGAVACGLKTDTPLMQAAFRKVCLGLYRSERQNRAFSALCDAFEKAGVDYAPLKGAVLKDLYPSPELRSMGDIDILIRPEQYPVIKPVMEQLGFHQTLESDHELIWVKNDLLIELHKRLIPSYNRDFYAYFANGWHLLSPVNGTHRFAFSAEDQMVYLFVHFTKHFRDGGIGMRHLLDLWVLRRRNDFDSSRVLTSLTSLGLDAFYRHINRLLDAWFEDGQADEITDRIGTYILQSGSFGTAENHAAAFGAKAGDKKRPLLAKISAARRLCFPGVTVMSYRYPAVRRCPVLLPLFWIVRAVDVLLFRRSHLTEQKRNLDQIGRPASDSFQTFLRICDLPVDTTKPD